MPGKRIVIVSPASARENNGNWQTASRWARFLRGQHRVDVVREWLAGDTAPDLLVALHARRSASSLAAFAAAYPERPSVLVLTGTDLYRDIDTDADARASLAHAHSLVLLQGAGLARLDPSLRPKARVIHQSAPALHLRAARGAHMDVCMIGHLREEKDPLAYMQAAALVTARDVRMLHIGGALDPALGDAARATQAATPRYRWLGSLPHQAARRRLARCALMVIASRMEGGANVIIEAVRSGVPVLASDIDGNRGMLGDGYGGYFAPGDAQALAKLVDRFAAEPGYAALLRRQCAARAALFAPGAEQAAVRDLVDNLLLARQPTESNGTKP